jgi:hypothetical protein
MPVVVKRAPQFAKAAWRNRRYLENKNTKKHKHTYPITVAPITHLKISITTNIPQPTRIMFSEVAHTSASRAAPMLDQTPKSSKYDFRTVFEKNDSVFLKNIGDVETYTLREKIHNKLPKTYSFSALEIKDLIRV